MAHRFATIAALLGSPVLMSHASMPEGVRKAQWIRDGLIRLSVGPEDIDDLREDLEQAFLTR